MCFQAKKGENRIRKQVLAFLLSVAFLLTSSVGIAEYNTDIAYQIRQAMADVGGMSLENCWDVMGMYTFGQTTEDGYFTISSSDETGKIGKDISWRNYPKNYEDIIDRYFPMLNVLLILFDNSDEEISNWVFTQEIAAIFSKKANQSYQSGIKHFSNFDIHIEYDAEYNELYCSLTATNITPDSIFSDK